MNQFPTLIEYLLLNHNYVVIPELGTFITQEMDAQWHEAEETFLPPFRSVRFNTELKQNDQLLLDAIAEIYTVGREQASQMLTTWIADFHQTLEDNGCIEFGTIGTFTFEEDNTLLFIAQESGIATPEYYGLDVFHISEVTPVQKTRTVPLAASMETDEREITIRINRRIANYVVAASAAILLFLVFNAPMSDNHLANQHSTLKEILMPAMSMLKGEKEKVSLAIPTNEFESQPVKANPSSQLTQTEKNTNLELQQAIPQQSTVQEQEQKLSTETEREYCIVMASAIPQSNAERFVERLTAEGFPDARIIQNGKMLRVVVGHYTSEQDAYKSASDIRQLSAEYRAAWVYYL